jgi:hypothetical protein
MSNQIAQLPKQLKELLRPYWQRINKLTKPIRRLLIQPLRRLPN